MLTKNIKKFNKKTLSKLINLLYVFNPKTSQHNIYKHKILSKEFHNFFGERKGRLKIKKRRWLNIRAHLRKETPKDALLNLTSNTIFESYLKLPQQNELYRFNRLNFINIRNTQVRIFKKPHTTIDKVVVIKKLEKMIKLLDKKYRVDRRNILALSMANFVTRIIYKIRKIKKNA